MNNRIAVFASGGGTNFQALIDEINRGNLHATIAGLISSRPEAGAIIRANAHGIPVEVIKSADYSSEHAFGEELNRILKNWDPALIVLAGYMLKVPANVIDAYPGRIINIHPALLPKFGGKGLYGLRVHRAVLEAGETESGCSVHIVTKNYDEGPVIGQVTVPVEPGDTPEELAERILIEEHKLLPGVTGMLLKKIGQE
ncbi:MAG: phosphoribosylglycinamide formyltransferase [Balneolaceae bacterium]|nr:MAG: phosphoribosylglycinamide formyltransferase [Balneolaceae bacterium]